MFRDATRADRPAFLKMFAAMYDDLEKYDCLQDSSPATMSDVAGLFDAYVEGALFGAVVLYEPPGQAPQGCMLIGEARGEMAIRASSKFGKIATLWGIYMEPSERVKHIGSAMVQNAFKKLRETGIGTVVFEVATGNTHTLEGVLALGCSPKAIVHTIDLREN